MTRIPVAIAGLALVAGTVVACGSDDGGDTTAADTSTSSSPSASASASASGSGSSSPTGSPSASDPPTENGDPVPSPIINQAVKAAIADGFPALVPSGVPTGWTVTKATYSPKRGGLWRIELTDPTGAPVTLAQSKKPVAGIVNEYLPDGQPTGTVDLGEYGTGEWSVYTGTGSAALAKRLSGTSAVVVGPDEDTVVALAEELLTAEDAGNSDGG